ncbi:MAG: hypothetical protein M1419_03370 [Bacteroidetes bacterium]|nr:hypothetical protein [Bacteroidota bacterium]
MKKYFSLITVLLAIAAIGLSAQEPHFYFNEFGDSISNDWHPPTRHTFIMN